MAEIRLENFRIKKNKNWIVYIAVLLLATFAVFIIVIAHDQIVIPDYDSIEDNPLASGIGIVSTISIYISILGAIGTFIYTIIKSVLAKRNYLMLRFILIMIIFGLLALMISALNQIVVGIDAYNLPPADRWVTRYYSGITIVYEISPARVIGLSVYYLSVVVLVLIGAIRTLLIERTIENAFLESGSLEFESKDCCAEIGDDTVCLGKDKDGFCDLSY